MTKHATHINATLVNALKRYRSAVERRTRAQDELAQATLEYKQATASLKAIYAGDETLPVARLPKLPSVMKHANELVVCGNCNTVWQDDNKVTLTRNGPLCERCQADAKPLDLSV